MKSTWIYYQLTRRQVSDGQSQRASSLDRVWINGPGCDLVL